VEAVFISDRSLVALSPFDGEVSWSHTLSDQPLGTSPSPVVAGDLLLASSTQVGGVGVKLSHAEGKTTPAEAWKNLDLSGYFSTPVRKSCACNWPTEPAYFFSPGPTGRKEGMFTTRVT
jgi:hypothetical protein